MLFLYRPRQTWMPYRLPRQQTDQAAYNRQLQEKYSATRRVPPAVSGADSTSMADVTEQLRNLAQLHADGTLSDDEFAAAKAKVLGSAPAGQ
jgi:hypothetical protein